MEQKLALEPDQKQLPQRLLCKPLHHFLSSVFTIPGNSRSFLSDSNIYTKYRFAFFVKFFLVDDSIDRNSSFTCLTVTDDQLTLTTTDRNHRVNRFDTCLQWLIYRLTEDYTRSFSLQGHFE